MNSAPTRYCKCNTSSKPIKFYQIHKYFSSRNDKNKQLIFLSKRKLALSTRETELSFFWNITWISFVICSLEQIDVFLIRLTGISVLDLLDHIDSYLNAYYFISLGVSEAYRGGRRSKGSHGSEFF
jgi:hypothetical protein